MAGQVKHASIFSSIRPDWRLVKLLASLPARNTDALIGGVQKVLADEGIHLADSTLLLKPLLAAEGALTRRKPDDEEEKDIDYGRRDRATRSPGSTSDRASPSASAPASRWKRWKAPTPCCAAPRRW